VDKRIGIFESSLAVNYRTFSNGRRKLLGNATMNDANDVILIWCQSLFSRSWDARQCIFNAKFFWRFWEIEKKSLKLSAILWTPKRQITHH